MQLRRLCRSPAAFWLAVAVVALATGWVAARSVAQVQSRAAVYGRLRPVVVATGAVEAGATVAPVDVEVRTVPAGLTPPGALSGVDAAVGRMVVVPLLPGLPVMAAHLAPDGIAGLAALLPPGARAVAVPRDSGAVPLRRGDLVDVLAVPEPGPAARGARPYGAVTLARAAPVIDVGPESATVAVGAEEAALVVTAVADGTAALVVTGPPPDPALPRPPRPGTPRTP